MLTGVGEGVHSEEKLQEAEKFACKIYNQTVESVDKARQIMFSKAAGPEVLPPTSNAFQYHMKRVHFQTMVWKQANVSVQVLPDLDQNGWELQDNKLVPVLMSRDPIPKACLEMIRCQCTTGCRSRRCKCKQSGLKCTGLCKCDNPSYEMCTNRTA